MLHIVLYQPEISPNNAPKEIPVESKLVTE